MVGQKETARKKKEKLFHPLSRKAGQLERKQLRLAKLRIAGSKRVHKAGNTVDRHAFFVHALPPDVECLSLPELHDIVHLWLTRHDSDIEAEQITRRKGRPPSAKEVGLIKCKEAELEEYRTGLEVIDLTSPVNVTLVRRWKQDDRAYLDILRYVRIMSQHPSQLVVGRLGTHQSLKQLATTANSTPPRTGANESQESNTVQEMDIVP